MTSKYYHKMSCDIASFTMFS